MNSNKIYGILPLLMLIFFIYAHTNPAYAPISSLPSFVGDKKLENFTINKLSNGTKTWSKSLLILNNKTDNLDKLSISDRTSAVGTVSTLNMSGINVDSTLDSTSLDITPFGNPEKTCTVKLADDYLNSVSISKSFPCYGTSHIVLNKMGIDALKNNLRIFNVISMKVVDSDNNTMEFSSSNAEINYHPQTYYAQVVNGKVVNVIVADQSFVNSLGGTWIETKTDGSIRGNFAGIGFTYDSIKDQFIPQQPYKSWILNSTGQWNSPIPYPNDGLSYLWDEKIKNWIKVI